MLRRRLVLEAQQIYGAGLNSIVEASPDAQHLAKDKLREGEKRERRERGERERERREGGEEGGREGGREEGRERKGREKGEGERSCLLKLRASSTSVV